MCVKLVIYQETEHFQLVVRCFVIEELNCLLCLHAGLSELKGGLFQLTTQVYGGRAGNDFFMEVRRDELTVNLKVLHVRMWLSTEAKLHCYVK